MKKINKHIEIVRSTIPRLNSMNRKSANAAVYVLSKYYTQVGMTIVNNEIDLEILVAKQPDLVFMGMKYVPSLLNDTKIWVSGYLEKHGIAHTGSAKLAIEFDQNKPLAKQLVLDAGIKTSPYFIVKNGKSVELSAIPLKFPLFVKPTNLGGGQGVDSNSVVHTIMELNAKIKSLSLNHGTDALVEEYLPGREYSVAVLKEKASGELIAMPIEIRADPNDRGDRLLSHARKSAVSETPTYPVTDSKIRQELIQHAIAVFIELGARDYGRIDIRLDSAGVPHFLEANLIPSLIEGSGNFPKACLMNRAMNYESMIVSIVELGLTRGETKTPLLEGPNYDDFDPYLDTVATQPAVF